MCFGGGLELALMCDILIASKHAQFAAKEIIFGLIPGAGSTIKVTRDMGKSKAMEMILTGENITATEALKWGLIS